MHPQIVESQCAETEVIPKKKSRSANIVQYAIPRFRFTPMWPLSPKNIHPNWFNKLKTHNQINHSW